jgi:hypothetical protein
MFFDKRETSEAMVYAGITPDVFARLRKKLHTHGVSVEDTAHGQLSAFGVAGEYAWDSDKEVLEIRITDKPFLVPHHLIAAHFREAVEEAGGLPG